MLYGSVAIGSTYLVSAVTLKEANIHPDQKKTLSYVTTAMFFLYYFCYGTSFAKVRLSWLTALTRIYLTVIRCHGYTTRR
jgi:hypothetical protein